MASPTDDPHQPMDDRLVNRRLFVQRRAGQLGGDHRTSAGELLQIRTMQNTTMSSA